MILALEENDPMRALLARRLLRLELLDPHQPFRIRVADEPFVADEGETDMWVLEYVADAAREQCVFRCRDLRQPVELLARWIAGLFGPIVPRTLYVRLSGRIDEHLDRAIEEHVDHDVFDRAHPGEASW